MIDELLRESGVIELLREEIAQEERAKSMAEGRAEGRAEGSRHIALIALESRFGSLADDLRDALTQADEATLEEVVGKSATETMEQVRERLGLSAN